MATSILGPTLRVKWTQAWLAWWYGRPALKRFKPLVRAAFAQGDQIDEARFLAEAGYYVAAACLCRTAIETQLRRAVCLSPLRQDVRRKQRSQSWSQALCSQGLWPKEQHKRYCRLYAALSGIAHNGHSLTLHCWTLRCWSLIVKSSELMDELDKLIARCVQASESQASECNELLDEEAVDTSEADPVQTMEAAPCLAE